MSEIRTKLRNYQGSNSFILKMKDIVVKSRKLTDNQIAAVEKIFKQMEENKSVELTPDLKRISEYSGTNSFINDIKNKLKEFGSLTEKQTEAAINQITKEENATKVHKMNVPAIGDTIKIGRTIGEVLKNQYNLKFNPILLDITKVLGFSEKAVKFSAKLTVQRGSVCTCCMKTLTDEFSMLTGVGKTCAKHLGIPYITDASQADKFREEYLKKVEEIGEMEVWVPKSQIKTWDGRTNVLLKMSKYWTKTN
jgi:hypothetical protein